MSGEVEATIAQMQSAIAEKSYKSFVELSDRLEGETDDPAILKKGFALGRGNPFVWEAAWNRLDYYHRADDPLDVKKPLILRAIETAARFGMLEEDPLRHGALVIAENYQLKDAVKKLISAEPVPPVSDEDIIGIMVAEADALKGQGVPEDEALDRVVTKYTKFNARY